MSVTESPDRTRVEVATDLTVTGKPAQFGRGVMQDVAGRIIDQFSANLASVIAASGARAAAEASGEPAPASAPTPLPQAADSIDLLGTAGAPVLKRAIPAVAIIAALVGIIWLIARRRG